MTNLFRSSPMFDTIEVVRETDWLREECIEDAQMDARDMCFHGLPKDEKCPDCLEDAYDPDYSIDFGFPR